MVINVNVLTNIWTILGILVTFAVALISLVFGTLSIRREDKRRKLEREERSIKEIIDWASDITIYLAQQIVTDRTNVSRIITGTALRLRELNVLAAKGIYIESMAPRIFPDNTVLLKDIRNFRLRIDNHIRFLSLVVNGKVIKNEQKAGEILAVRLRDDALNLIRLTTRLYTEIK